MKPFDINELWIGDLIQSSRTGIVGRYDGLHNSGKLKIRIDGKITLLSPDDAVIIEEKEAEDEQVFDDIQNTVSKREHNSIEEELDLHIEKLRPDLVNALPERIIDVQLKSFEAFMNSARQEKPYKVIIIHGKGTGVLRQHIQESLRSDKAVREFRLINNDGATEVLFY